MSIKVAARRSSVSSSTRLVRLREVLLITGLSRTTCYGLVAAGDFLRPVRLTQRCRAWVRSEVEEWVQARVENRCHVPSRPR